MQCSRMLLQHRICSNWRPVVYGLLFCINAFIRITNAAFICAVVLTAAFPLLLQKKFRSFVSFVLYFLLGVVIAALPPVIFFASKGLLGDMLYCVFAFGVNYATEGGISSRIAVFSRMLGWELMLFSPIAILLVFRRRNLQEWLLAVSSFLIVSFVLTLGNTYLHYFTLVLPSMVYALYLLVKYLRLEKKRLLRICAAVLAICLFAGTCFIHESAFIRSKARVASFIRAQAKYGYSRQSISGVHPKPVGIAASIPEDELDSVYVYGLPMDFFCQMDFFPCNKYCCWQDHYVELDPSIGEELRTYFKQTPPKWFLVRSNYTVDTLPEYFGDLTELYEDYDISGDFRLLRLKAV